MRLLNNLVTTLSSCNFMRVEDFQRNLLAVVQDVSRVFTPDTHRTPVNEAVKHLRCPQSRNLVNKLTHFILSQPCPIQTVDGVIVIEEDISPVLEQILLRRMADYIFLPSFFDNISINAFSKSSSLLNGISDNSILFKQTSATSRPA